MTLVCVLLVVFVVLKLAGLVAWQWAWVLSPLWITVALKFALLCIVNIRQGLAKNRRMKEFVRNL